MKVTMNSDGSQITIEAADVNEALEIIRGVRNGYPNSLYFGRPVAQEVALSPALDDVYRYLTDNGPGNRADMAAAFGIKVSAMDQRLRQLKKRGMVQQVNHGLWRSCDR